MDAASRTSPAERFAALAVAAVCLGTAAALVAPSREDAINVLVAATCVALGVAGAGLVVARRHRTADAATILAFVPVALYLGLTAVASESRTAGVGAGVIGVGFLMTAAKPAWLSSLLHGVAPASGRR